MLLGALPNRTPLGAKGGFLGTSFGTYLFGDRSPRGQFAECKRPQPLGDATRNVSEERRTAVPLFIAAFRLNKTPGSTRGK